MLTCLQSGEPYNPAAGHKKGDTQYAFTVFVNGAPGTDANGGAANVLRRCVSVASVICSCGCGVFVLSLSFCIAYS